MSWVSSFGWLPEVHGVQGVCCAIYPRGAYWLGNAAAVSNVRVLAARARVDYPGQCYRSNCHHAGVKQRPGRSIQEARQHVRRTAR